MNKQSTLSLFEDEMEMREVTNDTIGLQMDEFDTEPIDINPDAFHTSANVKAMIEDDDFEFETHTLDSENEQKESISSSLMNEVTSLIEEVDTQNDLNIQIGEDEYSTGEIFITGDEHLEAPVEVNDVEEIKIPTQEAPKHEDMVSLEFQTHTIETPIEEIQSFIDEKIHDIQAEPAKPVVENHIPPVVQTVEVTQPIKEIIEEEISEINVLPVVETTTAVTKEAFTELVGDINIISNDFVREISVKEEEVKEEERTIPFGEVNIMVIGIGDSGCTTINTLYELNNKEITTVSMHVSSQMLSSRYADKKILIGENLFSGNGSNGNNEDMVQAFEDDAKKVRLTLQGVDMLFLTGDFGTDVGSIGLLEVARIAKELGILTIGFPKILRRNTDFDTGYLIDTYLPQFKEVVDSTVIIDDNILFPKIAKFNLFEAVMYSDNMLINGIRGIYELITRAGKINLDYADIKTAFANRGDAILGCGKASGEHLVVKAIEDAFKSDVLDLASVKNAQTIIFNISCASKTVTIDNATEATNYIYSMASSGNVQQLFFGYTIDESLGEEVKVTFVAAGTTPTNDVPGAVDPNKKPFSIFNNEEVKTEAEVVQETKVEEKSKPRFFDF